MNTISPFSNWSLVLPPPENILADKRSCRDISLECHSDPLVNNIRRAIFPGDFGNVSTFRSDSMAVFFDGELHNRSSLLKELKIEESLDSAEIVGFAYRRWGFEFLEKIKGIFLIALLDLRNNKRLIARDRIGICSVFYSHAFEKNLVLSSSLAALVANKRVAVALNTFAVKREIAGLFCSNDETCYKNIFRLPAGHLLVADRDTVEIKPYWDPHPVVTSEIWASEEEVNQFGKIFIQSIENAAQASRYAVSLSGGLDSVSVAATATDLCTRPKDWQPIALSIFFPTVETNESILQKSIAAKLNMKLLSLDYHDALGQNNLFTAATSMSAQLAHPLDNVWYPVYSALRRLGVENGVETVLTGGGGDEWLTVSPLYSADLIKRFALFDLLSLARVIKKSYHLSGLAILRNVLWTSGLRPIVRDIVRYRNGFFSKNLLRLHKRTFFNSLPQWISFTQGEKEEVYSLCGQENSRDESFSHYFRDVRRALHHPLISMEHEENQLFSRIDGAKIRQPFWDADLVSLLYKIKPEDLFYNSCSKGLVRSWLASRFPGLNFERQKKVFATDFFYRQMKEGVQEVFRKDKIMTAVSDHGIIDGRMVEDAISKVVNASRREKSMYHFGSLIKYEAWIQNHF